MTTVQLGPNSFYIEHGSDFDPKLPKVKAVYGYVRIYPVNLINPNRPAVSREDQEEVIKNFGQYLKRLNRIYYDIEVPSREYEEHFGLRQMLKDILQRPTYVAIYDPMRLAYDYKSGMMIAAKINETGELKLHMLLSSSSYYDKWNNPFSYKLIAAQDLDCEEQYGNVSSFNLLYTDLHPELAPNTYPIKPGDKLETIDSILELPRAGSGVLMPQDTIAENKVVIFGYCRTSTELQGSSVEFQCQGMLNYVKKDPSRVLMGIYYDIADTGYSISKREALAHLLDRLQKLREPDWHDCSIGLVIQYRDRLTRCETDWIYLCDKLTSLGVRLINTQEETGADLGENFRYYDD